MEDTFEVAKAAYWHIQCTLETIEDPPSAEENALLGCWEQPALIPQPI